MANFVSCRLYFKNMRHCDTVLYQMLNRLTKQRQEFCSRVGNHSNTRIPICICRFQSTSSNRHQSIVSNYVHCGMPSLKLPQCMTRMQRFTSSFPQSHDALLTNTHKHDKALLFAKSIHTSTLNLSINGNNEEQSFRTESEKNEGDIDPIPSDGMEKENLSAAGIDSELNQDKLDVIPQNSSLNFVNRPNFKESVPGILHDFDTDEMDILSEQKEPKIVEEFSKPPLMPSSFTLASYVEHSEVLQKLVQLGVDLSKVENRSGVADRIIKLNFDPQVAEKISFLNFVGVESDDLGNFLTKNPHILFEEQENLEKRVKYLKSKKFDQAAIAQMVNRAPYLLCFSVERIDNKFGFYQQSLQLSGDELRQIMTAYPKLVTCKLAKVKENMFLLNKQFGFYKNEMKELIISHPRIVTRGQDKLISIFDYLHNDMGISHKLIMKNYQVFNSRAFLIQERHKFLVSIGRAQYDPTKPGYVSLKRLVTVPDDTFCEELAKVPTEDFNTFMKTL